MSECDCVHASELHVLCVYVSECVVGVSVLGVHMSVTECVHVSECVHMSLSGSVCM